jgi:DNA-binding LytR/AlgR family response regulator
MRCIIVEDDAISVKILTELISKTDFLEFVDSFSNADDVGTFLNNEMVDLIFLDIELPNKSGLEIIPLLNSKTQVIMVTGKTKYAIEAFEHHVTDYLLKPVTASRFEKAVQKAKEVYDLKHKDLINRDRLFLKDEGVYVNVAVEDVHNVEALGDYVTVVTKSKKFTLLSTMKQIEEKLPEQKFIRVHRSHIVNIDKIDTYDGSFVVVEKRLIPVGKSYKKSILSRLNIV